MSVVDEVSFLFSVLDIIERLLIDAQSNHKIGVHRKTSRCSTQKLRIIKKIHHSLGVVISFILTGLPFHSLNIVGKSNWPLDRNG